MGFGKEYKTKERTRKINNMDDIDACSCEGLGPQKQWKLCYKWISLLPADTKDTKFPKPDEDIIKTFKYQKREFFLMNIITRI